MMKTEKYCIQVGHFDGNHTFIKCDGYHVSFDADFRHCTLFDSIEECNKSINKYTSMNWFQALVKNEVYTGFVVIFSVDIELNQGVKAKNCLLPEVLK